MADSTDLNPESGPSSVIHGILIDDMREVEMIPGSGGSGGHALRPTGRLKTGIPSSAVIGSLAVKLETPASEGDRGRGTIRVEEILNGTSLSPCDSCHERTGARETQCPPFSIATTRNRTESAGSRQVLLEMSHRRGPERSRESVTGKRHRMF